VSRNAQCGLGEHLKKLGLEEGSTPAGFAEKNQKHPITSCWCYAVGHRRLNTLGLLQLTVEEIPRTDPLKILKFLKELGILRGCYEQGNLETAEEDGAQYTTSSESFDFCHFDHPLE